MNCKSLCGDIDCIKCFNKSFASIENSKYLHDKTINLLTLRKNICKKYQFDCYNCHHIFEQEVARITTGTWCSFCANRQLCEDKACIACFEKSFASHEKHIYWNTENELSPRQVFKGSHKCFKFNCKKCHHIFIQQVSTIITGSWCPFCVNKRLCEDESCQLCFEKSFASHEKHIYWNKENELLPRQVFKHSNKHFYFNCEECHHVFNIILLCVTERDYWCQFCGNQKLCEDESCQFCFKKSFASHQKHIYWSSNNKITPREVFKKSQIKYLFKCNNCDHEFDAQLSGIYRGEWCPFCAIPAKRLCDDIDCILCLNRSFASEEMSLCWSDKNELEARQVLKYSNKKYIFKCDICNHEFDSTLSNIIEGNKCPFCAIPTKRLCDDIDCMLCFNKSFASYEKAKYWSKKNTIEPRYVIKGSGEKYWFDCKNCNNSFESALNNVSNNRWCPICIHKTEKQLFKWLNENYNDVKIHISFDWCIFKESNMKAVFDFVIENKKIIIELDGDQHFKVISYWNSCLEDIQQKDFFKIKCANNNGYTVIRIYQKDVFHHHDNWEQNLNNALNKIYEIPQCIFIGKIYKSYIENYEKY